MTMCERLRRERIEIARFEGSEALPLFASRASDGVSRAKVHRYMRATKRGAYVPPAFVVRQGGEISTSGLLHGVEQVAAAAELGKLKVDAWVFDAADNREADEVGAIAFELAAAGEDILRGLRLRYGAANARETCAVTLFPAMRPAQTTREAARVRTAGVAAA